MALLTEATVATIFLHLAEFLRKTGKLNIFDTLVYNYRLKESLPEKTLQEVSADLLELVITIKKLLNPNSQQSNLHTKVPFNHFVTENGGPIGEQQLRASGNSVEINWNGGLSHRRQRKKPKLPKPKAPSPKTSKHEDRRRLAVEPNTNNLAEVFCCSRCSKLYKSNASFMAHTCASKKKTENLQAFLLTTKEEIEKQLKRFICGVCLQEVGSYERIISHLPTCEEDSYTCEICSNQSDELSIKIVFESMKLLDRHKRIKHQKTKCFVCNECNLTFCLKQSLQKHKRRRHEKQSFPCTLCDQIFERRINLTHHQLKEHRMMKQCNQCGIRCASDAALSVHIALKHNSMGNPTVRKKFICNFCSKEFPRKDKLQFHLSTHTGNKPFTCFTCGKSFSRKYKLEDHEARHLKLKKYTCQVNNCTKAYASNVDLKIHIRNHHPEANVDVNVLNPTKRKRIRKSRRQENQLVVVVQEMALPCSVVPEALTPPAVDNNLVIFDEIPAHTEFTEIDPQEDLLQSLDIQPRNDQFLPTDIGSLPHCQGYDYDIAPTQSCEITVPSNTYEQNFNVTGQDFQYDAQIDYREPPHYYQNHYALENNSNYPQNSLTPLQNQYDTAVPYTHSTIDGNFIPSWTDGMQCQDHNVNPSTCQYDYCYQQQSGNETGMVAAATQLHYSQNYYGSSVQTFQSFQNQFQQQRYQASLTNGTVLACAEAEISVGVSYHHRSLSANTMLQTGGYHPHPQGQL